MDETFHYIPDLSAQLGDFPPDSILSRTLLNSDRVKAVLFGLAAGQELSEHAASVPAAVHILSGTARLTLGGETRPAGAGTWVHMPAWLKHSVSAVTPVVMLLLLLTGGKEEAASNQSPAPG